MSEHDRERMFSNLSVAKIKGSGAEAITAEGIVAIGNFSVWFSHSWLKSVLMPLSFITNIFAEAYAITVPTVMYISALRRFVKERNM